MSCFYYVDSRDLENLKRSSIKLSYTQCVCKNAVQCEDKDDLFIIEADENLIESDKEIHIKHYESLLTELQIHNEIPGLRAVYNRVRFFNPVIWFAKVFRADNICNDKDIKWYMSHVNQNQNK